MTSENILPQCIYDSSTGSKREVRLLSKNSYVFLPTRLLKTNRCSHIKGLLLMYWLTIQRHQSFLVALSTFNWFVPKIVFIYSKNCLSWIIPINRQVPRFKHAWVFFGILTYSFVYNVSIICCRVPKEIWAVQNRMV